MYVLEFLQEPEAERIRRGFPISEFRLACSGELYNGRINTSDWRKSTATRILHTRLFHLMVVSEPFDDYPQELALRIAVGEVVEKEGWSSIQRRPDDEIAEDLAALLTLLLRRFITISTKVRVQHSGQLTGGLEPAIEDWPIPTIKSSRQVWWKQRPLSFHYGAKGLEEVVDYNPLPMKVDVGELDHLLSKLPGSKHANAFVLSARLYSQALHLMEQWPDIAYQLLIASVETIASRSGFITH